MASSSTARHDQTDPQNSFDQLAPFSVSTSTKRWQIFINHRGCDVKYTLASKIYQTLDGMGFRTFLDVEALEFGDVIPAEIQAAMISASLHIAIFSPNYAQSPWCLAELSFMLKTGSKIIPIFYHINPSDLRWIKQGKGKYAHAFSEHGKQDRYTQEKLDEWKRTLYNISFHYGNEVKNNEDEATVLKNIVNCALKVMKSVPLWVAEHPLRVDELVQEFESVASVQKVKIKGIVGMGGSGKTTLAKEFFNRSFSSFDRCSFVSEARDAASRNALPDKQKRLLEDLDVEYSPFDNVDKGKAILANRLSSLRVLIVLDDVDHIDQLNALLPNKDNLGYQSMVIVTSRELGVLKSWGLPCIYKMPGLERSHAEQLFCWHAFLQSSPPAGFETLVQKFIQVCDGLPLSLKVLGGQLYGNDSRGYWESQLNKISRILHGDIKERLLVSYDALDKEEKEMFLDVACFLIGENEGTAIAVWDGSGWSGLHGLQTLVNKCLVELVHERESIFDGDVIRMHDHLRDIGREIASKHSPYRFWWPEQIDNLKKHFKKGTQIRGIQSDDAFMACKEDTHQLIGISRRRSKRLRFSTGLQILYVNGHEFSEEFASLSENLVWLRWDSFPLKILPPWLTLRHLSVLQLYGADVLEDLWEDNADRPPLQLRELIVRGDRKLERLPRSIGRLEYLKKLDFKFCGSSLREEFCSLESLEYLKLYSLKLSSLPAGFGNLISLKHIYLKWCRQLSTLPESFEQLIHLEDLDLSYCKMLSSLPGGFGNLVSLKHINLEYCTQLSTLPESFKQLIHLEELDLRGCAKLKLKLDMLENIRELRVFKLCGCKELEDLPYQIVNQTSLRDLDLSGCIKLRGSPTNIGELLNLLSLTIESEMFKSLQTSLVNLSSLKSSKIESSIDVGSEDPQQVYRISISNDCCPNLETFNVWRNSNLAEIEALPVSLKVLSIRNCNVLKDMRCISGLVSLESLIIGDCLQIEELSSFADLASLKEFKMVNCPKVEKIEGLQHSKSLKKLQLQNTCWKVPGIQGLEKVEQLEKLVLECDNISAMKSCIQSLQECPRYMCIQWSVSRYAEAIVNSFQFRDLAVRKVKHPCDVGKIQDSSESAAYLCCGEKEEEC